MQERNLCSQGEQGNAQFGVTIMREKLLTSRARKHLSGRLLVNQIFTLSVNFQATNGEAVSDEWTTVTRKGKTILEIDSIFFF